MTRPEPPTRSRHPALRAPATGRAGAGPLLILLLTLLPATATADDGRRFLVLISGLGGEPYYSELFQGWSRDLLDVAHRRYGMDDAHTWYLAEAPDAEGRVDAVARKAAILDTLARVAEVSRPGDRVLLVLIGHGTAQGAANRFNLPGTDLTPQELARALEPLRDRRLAVVNTTPASAGFLRPLAAPGRIVITATASDAETQHTRFAGFFVHALGSDAADADKDRRISLLEAFRYAEREVERSYTSESRLRVEHAQLEDNGDAEASRQPAPESGDGALARAFDLEGPPAAGGSADPRRLQLQLAARRLVDDIERLKRERSQYLADDYDRRLENLLVELALNRRAYRAEEQP